MSTKLFYISNCRHRLLTVPVNNSAGFQVNKEGYAVAYTDGSCLNNGQSNAKAGIGVFFGDGHPLNVSKPLEKGQLRDSNMAEILAVIEAIKIVKAYDVRQIAIFSDSKSFIEYLRHRIPKWQKSNWTGFVSKTKRLTHYMFFDIIQDMNVKLQYVKGHNGNHGNEAAHVLARLGAAQYR